MYTAYTIHAAPYTYYLDVLKKNIFTKKKEFHENHEMVQQELTQQFDETRGSWLKEERKRERGEERRRRDGNVTALRWFSSSSSIVSAWPVVVVVR